MLWWFVPKYLPNTGFTLAPSGKGCHRKYEHPAVKIPAIISGRDEDDAKAYLERHIVAGFEPVGFLPLEAVAAGPPCGELVFLVKFVGRAEVNERLASAGLHFDADVRVRGELGVFLGDAVFRDDLALVDLDLFRRQVGEVRLDIENVENVGVCPLRTSTTNPVA